MKKTMSFIFAASLSGTVMAADINSNQDLTTLTEASLKDEATNESILNNEKMKRLHWDMTVSGMSEAGMEARVQMMSREGKAYHEALEEKEKKPQDNPAVNS